MRLSSIAFAITLISTSEISLAAPPPLPTGLEPIISSAPALPAGLPSSSAPALPSGLDKPKSNAPTLPSGLDSAPALPGGMDQVEAQEADQEESFSLFNQDEPFINVEGFWDIRGGVRTQNDPYEDQFSLGETRLQIGLQKDIGPVAINIVSDFLYDPIALNQHVDLQTGNGWVDLREANIAFSPWTLWI